MKSEAQAPLWVSLSNTEFLSDLNSAQIGELIRLFAQYLEDSYGPTIQTWCLRNEAEHANRIDRDLIRYNLNQHSV